MHTDTDRSLSDATWIAKGRIPSLDGLRAVAVLLVLLSHAQRTGGFPMVPLLTTVSRKGHIGVDIFFVISGFLITTLMLRERAATGRLALGRFYLRRVLRIVPAYVALLAAVAFMQATGSAHLSSRDWVGASTYTVNFIYHPAWEIGHAWSLSIEEHFYLLWPLLMATAAAPFGGRAAMACMGICFLGRWVILLAFPHYSPMAELWTFTRVDTIATGCLLAFLAFDPQGRRWLDGLCARPAGLAAAGLLLIGSLAAAPYSAKFAVGIGYTLNAVCIALLAWGAMTRAESRAGRLLNHPAMMTIGVASYSIYLWQQLFLDGTKHGPLCTFPLNLVLALAAAFACHYGIERPFLALKERLAGDPAGRATRRRPAEQPIAVSSPGALTGPAVG